MNLERLRRKIDKLDIRLIHLLNQRVRIALAIAQAKKTKVRHVILRTEKNRF